jgi:hypothetical protein
MDHNNYYIPRVIETMIIMTIYMAPKSGHTATRTPHKRLT